MNPDLYKHCKFCFRARDAYSDLTVHQAREQRSQWDYGSSSATRHSKATAGFGRSAGKIDISSAQTTSEGASPKSGSLIDIGHDVTPEETSISLSKISKHAHVPSERELALEKPIDEPRKRKEPDTGAVTADETSILEDIYEQWTADDVWRDTSGDTRLGGEVEPKPVNKPSADSESDLDSLLGPLIEPRTGDSSSDDQDTSEQIIRTKLNRGTLLPPVIYLVLVRAYGIITRLFEPNPLPGRTRIRWGCVSYSRWVQLMQRFFFT